jgi:hypothetical protein
MITRRDCLSIETPLRSNDGRASSTEDSLRRQTVRHSLSLRPETREYLFHSGACVTLSATFPDRKKAFRPEKGDRLASVSAIGFGGPVSSCWRQS